MTTLEIVLIGVIWAELGVVMLAKQNNTGGLAPTLVVLAVVFPPLYLIGAIIRQVFIEKWK